MSFYKLAFKTATGESIAYPSDLNNKSDNAELIEFAQKHGHDTEQWDLKRKGGLSRCFFEHVHLKPVEIDNPKQTIDWSPFKKALHDEPSLFEYPWNVFERRIEAGLLSAIIDDDNKPVATVNLIPKLNDPLYKELGIDASTKEDNPPQVFETGAGWTDDRFRKMGLYSQMRSNVLEEAQAKGRLLFSQAKGKGASFVNIKDGYTLVNPKDYPFAASLMGWEPSKKDLKSNPDLDGKFLLAAGKIIELPERGPYVGPTVHTKAKDGTALNENFFEDHKWEDYHHLWVNDLEMLIQFENNLMRDLELLENNEDGKEVKKAKEVVEYGLEQWRKHVRDALFQDIAALGITDSIKENLEQNWKAFRDPDPALAMT